MRMGWSFRLDILRQDAKSSPLAPLCTLVTSSRLGDRREAPFGSVGIHVDRLDPTRFVPFSKKLV